jgi:hypothetical protein
MTCIVAVYFKECWCQLPDLGEIIAPKHVVATCKIVCITGEYAVAQLVEVPHYKSEGLGFDTR